MRPTIQRRAMQIISPHKTYEEALCEHRLVTLQQRRNELCNRLFKDIQKSSHRLNSLLPRQHNPGYQLRHSKKYLDIPRITIDGDVIECVSCAKLLGCHVMSNLSWEDHIANLVSKASHRLHLLKELKRAGLSSKDLLTCYFSFVRSKTEYACRVWSTTLTIEQSHAVETNHPAPSHADHLPPQDIRGGPMRTQASHPAAATE